MLITLWSLYFQMLFYSFSVIYLLLFISYTFCIYLYLLMTLCCFNAFNISAGDQERFILFYLFSFVLKRGGKKKQFNLTDNTQVAPYFVILEDQILLNYHVINNNNNYHYSHLYYVAKSTWTLL